MSSKDTAAPICGAATTPGRARSLSGLRILSLLGLLLSCSGPNGDSVAEKTVQLAPYDPTGLAAIVEQTMNKYDLPALGVLIGRPDDTVIVAVSGIRKLGSAQPVTVTDHWFIGSAAKPMTAVLMATFVQDGQIEFSSTLEDIFPEYAGLFTDASRLITVQQLLTHTSGLKANPVAGPGEFARLMGDTSDTVEQRKIVLRKSISEDLLFTPGSETAYSNTGYILAGAIADKLGGTDYESLIGERVFCPLGITSYGFGQPAKQTAGQEVDQPWGHRSAFFRLKPTPPGDPDHVNPSLFNPAGNLYLSLKDWALFAGDSLKGRRGQGKILEQTYYEQLHMPPGGESGYAMGWGVLVEEGVPIMLTHNGSDGNWFADARLYPNTGLVLLTVTNDGREDDEAKAAAADIRKDFNKRYAPYGE